MGEEERKEEGKKAKISKVITALIAIGVVVVLLIILFPPTKKTPDISNVLARAKKHAEAVNNEVQRNSILKEIAITHAKAENIEEAIHIAKSISDEYGKALALVDVADSLADKGDILNSERVLGLIPQHISAIEMPSNSHLRSNAQAHMAESYARIGQIQTARELISNTDANDSLGIVDKAMVIEEIAKKQAFEGNVDAAIKTILSIGGDYSYSGALRDICVELAKEGKAKDSLEIAKAIDDVKYRDGTIRHIAEAQVKTGDIQGATETIESIQDVDRKTTAWLRVIDMRLRNNATGLPSESLEQALIDVRKSSKTHLKMIGLSLIAVAKFEGGNINKAKELLQEIRQIAGEEDLIHLRHIAFAYAWFGEINEAMKIAQDSKDEERDYTIFFIVEGLCRTGMLEESIKTLEQINDTGVKAASIREITTMILEQKNRDANIIPTLRKLSLNLGSIEGMLDDRPVRDRDPKLEALRLMVIAQTKLADWEGALRTFDIIHRDYNSIWWAGERALYDVAHAQAKMGLEDKALSLVKKYKDADAKTYILLGIANGMLEKKESINASITRDNGRRDKIYEK